MPAVAVKKNTFDGLNPTQQGVARWVCSKLQLGQPALYQTGGGVNWYVFDDSRITLDDIAILGCVAAHLVALASYSGPITAAGVRDWAIDKVVWPADITYTTSDPYTETLTAQSAPASVAAGSGVPANWTAQ